jgi:hypothetical protein
MKTPTLFREYIWLVNTIYKARAITLAEINRLWLKTEMSEGIPLSRTTFHRHRNAIEDIFGLIIDCNKKNGNKYYISNGQELQKDSVQNWMLSTLSVSNMLGETQSLHHRILLENVPSGDERLRTVINAMKQNRQVNITYKRYAATSSSGFTIEPYCVKLFRQRWYVLGRLSNGYLATFSFDRIREVTLSDKKFKMPRNFDAADYFSESFGIVVDDNAPAERIVLRAYGYEPYYLRDLPLHPSQRIISTTEEYTDFELKLKITTDFKSKLLSRGEWIEVLKPQSLADDIREWHQIAAERYKK